MVKKTENKKQKSTADTAQKQKSNSTKVETVKAEKVEKTSTGKPSPKYHVSINLSSNNSAPPTQEAIKPSSTNASSKEKKDTKPKQSDQNYFTKETEAVRIAETIRPKDIKHLKYSEQKKSTTLSGKDTTAKKTDDKKPLPISPKVEKLKPSIDEIKSDPKAFKELQDLVKPSLINKIKTEIAKRASLKYLTYVFMRIMKAIDLFISFVIMPRGEGRNPALQKARSPILFGLWVFFVFFIIGGFWAGFAPLDKAVQAQGFVVTSSKKQVIQHKEGGVVEAIYVKEGDHIKTNQPLVKLEDSQMKLSLQGLYEQRQSFEKHLKATQEQLKSFTELAEKGFIAQLKVTELEVKEASIKGELSKVNSEISIKEEYVEKLILKSPINGIVTQINVTTIGGTVGGGNPIMTITPSQEDLILEAYVRAQDIEPVHVGLKAKVNISAFRSKTTSYIEGIVTYVSPDVIDLLQQQGRQTQEGFVLQRGIYYKVKISIDKKQLKQISKYKDYELVPGMDASVQITIGERTLIQYLLDPILMTFWYALKEK